MTHVKQTPVDARCFYARVQGLLTLTRRGPRALRGEPMPVKWQTSKTSSAKTSKYLPPLDLPAHLIPGICIVAGSLAAIGASMRSNLVYEFKFSSSSSILACPDELSLSLQIARGPPLEKMLGLGMQTGIIGVIGSIVDTDRNRVHNRTSVRANDARRVYSPAAIYACVSMQPGYS
ncbi:hypothetical protein EVAR_3075_1 [Eumeta japonica]|uniref:Uncharacterized protein n=1 Tax=Eumeta variegata TaxID=151549 RepID=A0A4C1SX46_EUMVA|nr:hypothetical protein EVAR_3075_1 [Eumeta japonica]